ncbi:MAG: DUF2103 domain-containing protein [Thermodesulfobacteriota bacterium]
MKYRKNKIKREHGIIKGLKSYLEKNISDLDFVSGIIPGEITVGSATGENLIVKYKYSTLSGAKLIARSGSSVQEVFVVTSDPERLKEVIDSLN